jgi:hypothetical protein
LKKVIHTDIFIAGAGAAGIAAAIAAAEAGLTVHVAERNSFPGGRASASAVGTICGLYLRSNASSEFVMQGFPKKFAEAVMEVNGKAPAKFSEGLWFLPCRPEDFEKVAEEFLDHPNISVLYNTSVADVESSQRKINAVLCTSQNNELKIIPRCVIDCSGEGIVCTQLKHEIISDKEYQAAAIVFSVEGISTNDEFQLGFSLLKKIAQEIEAEKLPAYYNLLSIVPHSLYKNSLLLKMGLPWQNINERSAGIEEKANGLVKELFDFIQTNVHGFENARMQWIAREVGFRTGIRAKGKNVLSDHDVLTCKKTDEGIANGAWAIEYWKTGNKRVEMTYFMEEDFYSIPAGCLESGEKENFFFAGKIISAEERAIASARVIGTCFGTGYAAGILAAYHAMNKGRMEAITFIRKQML